MYSSASLMKCFLLDFSQHLMPQEQFRINLDMKESLENGLEFLAPYNWPQMAMLCPFANQLERLSVLPPNCGILVHLEEKFSASYILYYMLLHIIFSQYMIHCSVLQNISKVTFVCRSLCIHTHIELCILSSGDYYVGKQFVDMKCTFQCIKDNKMLVLIEQFYYVFHNSQIVTEKVKLGDCHDRLTDVNK